MLDIVREDARDELVRPVAVPPAVHVGLAQGEGSAGEDAAEEIGVAHPEIPGTLPVHFDVRDFQDFPGDALRAVHCRLPIHNNAAPRPADKRDGGAGDRSRKEGAFTESPALRPRA